ncbi:hypothetical protein Tco_0897090 [Tanacetum coccineum]
MYNLSILRISSYLFCSEFPTPTPAMVNHNDVLDDDEDEPLNENDHDNEDELNNIDEGEELNAHHLVLAQSGVDIVGTGYRILFKWTKCNTPVDDATVGDEIVDDDVPKERVKGRFKITGKRKLYQVFEEDEDDEDYGHF